MSVYIDEETDGNLINTSSIIEEIENIIEEIGCFCIYNDDFPELEATHGNLKHKITYLDKKHCYVEVFSKRLKGVIVDSYILLYKEIAEEKLKEILEICKRQLK